VSVLSVPFILILDSCHYGEIPSCFSQCQMLTINTHATQDVDKLDEELDKYMGRDPNVTKQEKLDAAMDGYWQSEEGQ